MGQLVPHRERKLQVRDLILKQSANIQAALPRHMSVDRFARIMTTVVLNDDKLLDCTPHSLVACLLQSAAWGLELDPVLGMAYLVPYKGVAKLIPGYRGLVELARRSGDVYGVTAIPVYEGDVFVVTYGLKRDILHEPRLFLDRGELIGVYAVADMRLGPPKFEVMTIEDVNAVRKRSAAGGAGPWVTDFEAMALKTVTRRLCSRQLPRTPELARAVALDEQADRGEDQTYDVDLPPLEPTSEPKPALDVLTEQLEKKRKPIKIDGPSRSEPAADEIFAGHEGAVES